MRRKRYIMNLLALNLETWQQIVTLITGLVGLISAAIGVFFGIKSTIQKMKSQTADQNWQLIISVAKTAMESAEASGKSGADKKEMVIEAVKAALKEAGVNADDFMDQLSDYIDNMIEFANTIAENKKK